MFPGSDAPRERPRFGGKSRFEEASNPPPAYLGDMYPDGFAPSLGLFMLDGLRGWFLFEPPWYKL